MAMFFTLSCLTLHRPLLSLFLFSLFHRHLHLHLHASSPPPSSPSSPGDAQLLLRFKASVRDPALLRDWQPSLPPCSFSGVSCDGASRVSAVDLYSIPLASTVPTVVSTLLALESLQNLTLKSTKLTGAASAVRCGAMLAALDLSNNSLSGSLSDLTVLTSSCRSLKSLNLSLNLLNRSLPDGPAPLKLLGGLRALDLSSNGISEQGVVKWLFQDCRCGDLNWVSLSGNRLSGSLPAIECAHLEHLDLSSNNFTAALPSLRASSALRRLDLSDNRFAGDLRSGQLAGLRQLDFLNLSTNHLSGEVSGVPAGWALRVLNLSGNHFEGALRDDAVADLCSSLVEVDLSYNNLNGTIPAGFSECAYLESLNLSNNSLSGELAAGFLGKKMASLRKVVLAYNNFSGHLPPSLLAGLPGLESLDISSNQISGQIPAGLCRNSVTSLKELYLQNNLLSGSIPADLCNCSQLVSLDLSFNKLTGEIPESLGSLTNLRDLILWLNDLTGNIPEELGNVRLLESLILDFNNLTGPIPAGLRYCTNLYWISLSNNRLSGEIPPWLGRLSSLAILKLSNNSFYGGIPPELGNCQSLVWVDLNSNSLTGSIPPELFMQSGKIADGLNTRRRYAYIKNDKSSVACHGAGNLLEFVGIRTTQLDRLSARSPCNFTRVYGGILRPTFNHNGSVIFFDVSYNSLSGSIPPEMGKMYYLQVLHLSHNNFSGQIPPQLGDLNSVSIMDLSDNGLEGNIPSSFSRLSALNELDLSSNRLWGKIPESTQMLTFPNTTFVNNRGLCGYPLSACPNAGAVSGGRKKSRTPASFAGTVAMGSLFSVFCVVGLIVVAVETKKRRRNKGGGPAPDYLDSNFTGGGNTSDWRVIVSREALSINLATFDLPLRTLTFADLQEATNGFHPDALIGSGGFGEVYRAELKDGTVVAIKKLIHINGQGDREFTAEVETIGKIRHRNLVALLGYCKVKEERLLVYEFMRFGSLEDVLRDRRKAGIRLNWAARRRIAVGAARGLAFLHKCNPHVIHRDMKSSNVLLDERLEARVADFGMARVMNAVDTHLSVSTLAGTPGYVPPEYYQSFRCSTKGDVYSYGVVLLELLTGRQPTDSSDFGDNNLVGWVKQRARSRIADVFDPALVAEGVEEVELLQHLKVATRCLDERPLHRPTMIQVMAMFKEIQAGCGGGFGCADAPDSASTLASDIDTEFGGRGVVETSIAEGRE